MTTVLAIGGGIAIWIVASIVLERLVLRPDSLYRRWWRYWDEPLDRDRRPHKTEGHATYCDCGQCMLDGNESQWRRRGMIP